MSNFPLPSTNFESFEYSFQIAYNCLILKLFFDLMLNFQVLELLTHVNKRLKSRPTIELPLQALLVQYMVRIIFIKHFLNINSFLYDETNMGQM